MAEPKGKLVSPELEAQLRQMAAWIRNLRVSGPGVSFKNTGDGASITVNTPPPSGDGGGPIPITLLKITGNAGCNGVYTARVWLPPSSAPNFGSGSLSEAMLGTTDDTDVYFVNLMEVAKSTHDLTHADNTDLKLVEGLRRGVASDGKTYYVSRTIWMVDCEEPA